MWPRGGSTLKVVTGALCARGGGTFKIAKVLSPNHLWWGFLPVFRVGLGLPLCPLGGDLRTATGEQRVRVVASVRRLGCVLGRRSAFPAVTGPPRVRRRRVRRRRDSQPSRVRRLRPLSVARIR